MSPSTQYLPNTEADLLAWSTNFDAKINLDPPLYGLNATQASEYSTLHRAYADAYQTTRENDTRTPSSIVTKRVAMKALKSEARKLARIVQAFPGTTDTLRSDLGLTIPDVEPTPIPPPKDAPEIDFLPTGNRTIRIRLHNDKTLNRRKPAGVVGATLFSYIGETAPADINDWKFEGNTTKTVIEVDPPASVPSGSTVWFTAFWRNPRDQSGPATTPISTVVQYGGLAIAA